MLRWPPLTSMRDRGNNGQSIATASRQESEKRPGTGEWATGGRWEMQTAQATSRGAADSDKCCNDEIQTGGKDDADAAAAYQTDRNLPVAETRRYYDQTVDAVGGLDNPSPGSRLQDWMPIDLRSMKAFWPF